MKLRRPQSKQRIRKGYTLLELTFSIGFFSAIVMTALAGFIGIFNAYNRAQGLTRTQLQTRTAMDSLITDLRNTQNVVQYSTGGVSPAHADALAGSARDIFCLTGEGFSRGYASLYLAATNHYHLVRMQSCASFTNYEMLIGTDVWFNATTGVGNNGGVMTGANAPLQIRRLGNNADPVVWSVRVSGHRGVRIPGATDQASLLDPLSAETILETVVTTRK